VAIVRFPGDGSYLFTMTQWVPAPLCLHSDFQGWQNHQFYYRKGQFALTGSFKRVQTMTVPADHVISATGECLNYTAFVAGTIIC